MPCDAHSVNENYCGSVQRACDIVALHVRHSTLILTRRGAMTQGKNDERVQNMEGCAPGGSVGELYRPPEGSQRDFFCGGGSHQTHGRFALPVGFGPLRMILVNLLDVMRDVAQLQVEPSIKRH